MSDELPPRWVETTLGAVVSPQRPKVSPSDHPDLPFVGMDQIEPNSMSLSGTTRFGDMKSNGALFRDGDVLYGRMRPYLNKVHRARFDGACSAEFIVFPKSDAIDSDLLAYLLHHRRFVNFASEQSAGDRPRVDFGSLEAYALALPPRSEQSRIVSKIDELFSRIEEGERALERVQTLVERYRQSVLRAAVTGELTREWREQRQGQLESGDALLRRILRVRREVWAQSGKRGKYTEPAPATAHGLPAPADGWAWASLEQLCSEFGNGLSKKPANEPPGAPILRISAVRSLSVNDQDLRYYTPADNEDLSGYWVSGGDLLFTRYNGSQELVGVSGVFKGTEPVLHPDKLIRARVVDPALVDADYLAICMNAGESWRHITQWVKTSAGQHGIAGSDVKRAPVPLPSVTEQRQIVDAVHQALSRCGDAISSVVQEERRAQGLRQAILKLAFAGGLVA